MAKFILNAVVKQQLAVSYLMQLEYNPNLTIEEFAKKYTETLKNKKGEIQVIIKKISVKG